MSQCNRLLNKLDLLEKISPMGKKEQGARPRDQPNRRSPNKKPKFRYSKDKKSHRAPKTINNLSTDGHQTEKHDLGNNLANEETAIPNPTPETGVIPSDKHSILMDSHSIRPAQMTRTNPQSTQTMSIATTYPPTMTVFHPISPQAPPTQATSATLFGPTLNSPSGAGGLRDRPQPHGFSTPIVALLAAGGGCALIGIFILVRFCSRPRPRPRPKPSLPIFDDPFAEETGMSTKESESPIFGGKERLSPRPASNNGFGTWTQYTQTHPPLAFPSKAASNEDLSEQGYSAIPYLHNQNTTSHEPHPPPGPGQSVEYRTEANSQMGMPMHQRRLSRITARFSMASVSMYPGSPPIPEGNREGNTPFTADGHPVIKRNTSRASLHAVARHSFQEYGQGLAYDGADIFSPDLEVIPVIASAPSAPARGGRTRIKSSYYTAPRASALPTSLSSGVVDATQDIPHQQPLAIKRSDSRKDRDTRALTYALGLSSPPADYAALSPQPTLYPDDSLSVIDTRRQNRCSHKKAVESGCNSGEQKDSPALPLYMDPNAALGNLMLMDYNVTSKSLAADGGWTAQESATWMPGPIESTSKKSFQSRSDDRPPRVPSPPPLPSLAQMGLEHANPEAYANYHSPMYSIYGLYETDRKSRII